MTGRALNALSAVDTKPLIEFSRIDERQLGCLCYRPVSCRLDRITAQTHSRPACVT